MPISSSGGGGEDPRDLTLGPGGDARFYFRATDASMPAGVFRLYSYAGVDAAALALPVAMPPATLATDSVTGPLWPHNGVLYVGMATGATGQEVFRVVPSLLTGLQLAADLIPGISSSSPFGFASLGTSLLFLAGTAVDGQELWTMTGSGQFANRGVQPALTGLQSWTQAAGGGTLDVGASMVPFGGATAGGALVFSARPAAGGGPFALWQVAPIAPSSPPSPSAIPAPTPPPANAPLAPPEGPAGEIEMSLTMLGASIVEVTAPVALALEDGIAAAMGVVSGGARVLECPCL